MRILFLLFFAVYLWTAVPTTAWFDTGELAVGAFVLGNGHPPGQPLYAMSGKAATLLPVASIPFRLTLFSAFCSALAMALLPGLLQRVNARLELPPPSRITLWMVVPGLGLMLPVWLQAVRLELYALQLLLTLIMLSLALQDRVPGRSSPGPVLVIGLLVGLAWANHPLLTLLLVPGLALLIGWPGLRTLGWGLASAALGVSLYLYGPLRSSAHALLDWGRPDRWDRFWAVFTGRAYQRSFVHLRLEQLLSNLEQHGLLLLALLGGPLILLAVIGLIRLARRPRLALAFVALMAGNVAATALQSVFSPENPDALGYLTLVFVLCGLMGALGFEAALGLLDRMASRLSRQGGTGRLIGAMFALFVATVPALRAWPRPDLHENWTNFQFARDLLRSLPVGSLYLSGSDATTLSTWYQQVISGARPDVTALSMYATFGTAPLRNGYAIPSGPAGTPLSGASLFSALVRQESDRRPVHLTANDLPLAERAQLRADLLTLEVSPAAGGGPLDRGLEAVRAHWTREIDRLLATPAYLRDRQARLLFPAHLEALGDHFRELGLWEAALAFFRLAERLDPDPTRLVRLKRARLEALIQTIPAPPPPPDPATASRGARLEQAERSLHLGRRLEARQWLEGLAPDPPVLLARARLGRLEGDSAAAVDALRQLRRVAPTGPDAVEALCDLHALLPSEEALAWLKGVLPGHRDPRLATALATRLREAGALDEADSVLTTTLVLFPASLEAHLARAWLRIDQGRPLEARSDVLAALEQDPVEPAALRLKSFLYRSGIL